MSNRKWYSELTQPSVRGMLNADLEAATDDAVFGGQESAFSSLGLTRTQRIGGFIICFVAGLGISLLGAILLVIGATGAFASLFAIGGIVSLVGTGFLVGFRKQLETMFKPVRIAATIILFLAIAMTFVSAFLLPAILCIIFVLVQYLAYLWYSLSYIPYARTLVKNWFGMATST